MADILCTSCGDPAVLTVMMYGENGGSMDLCNLHVAEWAYGVVKGAYPGLAELLDNLESQGAGEAETPQEPPKRARKGKTTPEAPEGAQGPPEPPEGTIPLQRAEHGG